MSAVENHLARESSAYLRSAAHQPIEWYPWGREAFERARDLDRPILLDIGAVWCHWCHVMDRETYENPEVARIINESFVAMKVDRDERPDVDARYQSAVASLTGQSGWPLTVFLTPDGRAFSGGTYFPPEDTPQRPGMKTILQNIIDLYSQEKEFLKPPLAKAPVKAAREIPSTLKLDVLSRAIKELDASYDAAYGGFGYRPKFPQPTAIQLLLIHHFYTNSSKSLEMARTTLDFMGRGGIHDQLGGGFHRYSTDEDWIVPHFEKMCADNAELLRTYIRAYQITGEPYYREVALGITRYVNSVSEGPGFFASLDADSEGIEGAYYTWTPEQVRRALPPDLTRTMRLHFGINEIGEMYDGRNVLHIAVDYPEVAEILGRGTQETRVLLEKGRSLMLQAREEREKPFLDKTLYVSWNCMMTSAYLDAASVLERWDLGDRAIHVIKHILERGYNEDRGVAHWIRGHESGAFGLLEDNAWLLRALLDAYETTMTPQYLERALEVASYLIRNHWDDATGGFYDVNISEEMIGPEVLVKPAQDAPNPSPNSIAIMALDKLATLTADETYRQRAEEGLRAIAAAAEGTGIYGASYYMALENHLRGPISAIIAGPMDEEDTLRLWRTALSTYRPGKTVRVIDPDRVRKEELPEHMRGMIQYTQRQQRPLAFVCAGQRCTQPTDEVDQLTKTLRDFAR